MTAKLTESIEDYMEAIAELAAVEGHAHSKEIAERLQVTMPSVTGALRHLAKLNYIVYSPHSPVELTPDGWKVARRVIHRHRILKNFFSRILGLSLQQASETACKLEHIISEDAAERFVIFSEAIENRSDARTLKVYLTEAMANLSPDGGAPLCVMSALAPGDSAVVVRWSRNLRSPERVGVAVGETLTLAGVSLDRTALNLTAGGRGVQIAFEDAENIWVRRLAGPERRPPEDAAGDASL